jgi:hypothetical protein
MGRECTQRRVQCCVWLCCGMYGMQLFPAVNHHWPGAPPLRCVTYHDLQVDVHTPCWQCIQVCQQLPGGRDAIVRLRWRLLLLGLLGCH